MRPPCTRFITTFLLVVLAIAASMLFIEKPVALGIWEFTSTQPSLHNHIKEIPNNLPHLVAAGTATMWLAYYVIFRKHGWSVQAQFFQLAASAVPAAYQIKIFLQNAFGRTSTRLWLRVGGPIEFRWFNPVEYGGFPSGHSMVLAALFTAV